MYFFYYKKLKFVNGWRWIWIKILKFLNKTNALQNIDCDELDITQLQNALKDILQKFYPKDDKEIIDQKSGKRINNLPLNNIHICLFWI